MENIEWARLNNEPFTTHKSAQRFLDIMTNQHFGSGKEVIKSPDRDSQLRIIEEKAGYYIEYKMLEKHTL